MYYSFICSDTELCADHLFKLSIVVACSANVTKYAHKLREGDDAISLLSVPGIHEFHVDVALTLVSSNDIRMSRSIINLCDVIEFNLSIAVDIQLIISPLDCGKSACTQISSLLLSQL